MNNVFDIEKFRIYKKLKDFFVDYDYNQIKQELISTNELTSDDIDEIMSSYQMFAK